MNRFGKWFYPILAGYIVIITICVYGIIQADMAVYK